ncbi:MAG TPA: phosphatidylglycerophosphatase A [Candidatus Binatia bacterium]|nr:phosphatidylglycerophosphatase A [Candidatus Binatia bacterium]
MSAADRVAVAIATAAGTGYAPVAPGTVVSLLTAVALWLLPFTLVTLVVTLVAVIAAGVWSGHRAERVLGRKDPSAVVVDEVAGMMLSVLLVPRTPAVLLSAFVLFRIFDVWKPFPAYQSQALPGGWGVMADDVVAGLYALLAILLSRALTGLPA